MMSAIGADVVCVAGVAARYTVNTDGIWCYTEVGCAR